MMDDEEVHYDGIKKQEWSISKLQRLFQFKVTEIWGMTGKFQDSKKFP